MWGGGRGEGRGAERVRQKRWTWLLMSLPLQRTPSPSQWTSLSVEPPYPGPTLPQPYLSMDTGINCHVSLPPPDFRYIQYMYIITVQSNMEINFDIRNLSIYVHVQVYVVLSIIYRVQVNRKYLYVCRNGIKSKETRLGWGEAHNVRKACLGITEGFKANMCT